MKKRYIKPSVELVRFKYSEQVVANSDPLLCGEWNGYLNTSTAEDCQWYNNQF